VPELRPILLRSQPREAFYVNTEGTEAIGVRGHAATKEQQLKGVAVC